MEKINNFFRWLFSFFRRKEKCQVESPAATFKEKILDRQRWYKILDHNFKAWSYAHAIEKAKEYFKNKHLHVYHPVDSYNPWFVFLNRKNMERKLSRL
jgi:hypothetical protein